MLPSSIHVTDLRRVCHIVLDYLEHDGRESVILLGVGYHWCIDYDVKYNPYITPPADSLTLGDLYWEWPDVRRVLDDHADSIIHYHFVWLGYLFQYIGLGPVREVDWQWVILDASIIPVSELRAVCEALFDYLEHDGQEPVIDLQADYHYEIPPSDTYNAYATPDPERFGLGQLSHEWADLLKLLDAPERVVHYDCVWLGYLFEYIGLGPYRDEYQPRAE